MPLNPKVMVGGTEIKRAYQGAVLLFDRTSPDVSIVTDIPEVEAVFVAEPAYLYTDAGVTNVTANGDAVQEWHSTDGAVVLSLVGSGVTYQESGGLAWVETDGNGRLEGAAPPWAGDLMLAAAAEAAAATYVIPVSMAEPEANLNGMWLTLTDDGTDRSGLRVVHYMNSGDNYDATTTFAIAPDTAYVIVGLSEPTQSRVRGAINNEPYQEPTNDKDTTSNVWPAGSASQVLTIGGEGGSTPGNQASRVYGFVVAEGIPSTEDIGGIKDWLAAISDVDLSAGTP